MEPIDHSYSESGPGEATEVIRSFPYRPAGSPTPSRLPWIRPPSDSVTPYRTCPEYLVSSILWDELDTGVAFDKIRCVNWERPLEIGNERCLTDELFHVLLERLVSAQSQTEPDPCSQDNGQPYRPRLGFLGLNNLSSEYIGTATEIDFLTRWDIVLLPIRALTRLLLPGNQDRRTWCAGIIFTNAKKVCLYDPMNESLAEKMTLFLEYFTELLQAVHRAHGRGRWRDSDDWTWSNIQGFPKATNDEEAGVYTYIFLRHMAGLSNPPTTAVFDVAQHIHSVILPEGHDQRGGLDCNLNVLGRMIVIQDLNGWS